MKDLNIRLQALSIFRALLADPVVFALGEYLESLEQDNVAQSVSRYAAFVSRLYDTEKRTLAGYIQSIVNNDENAYIRLIGRGLEPWPEMVDTVEAELETLQALADLTPEILAEGLAGADLDPAHLREVRELLAERILREAEFRDAVAEHATGFGHLFEEE